MARRVQKSAVETIEADQPIVTVETLAEAVKVGSYRTLTNTDWKGSTVQVNGAEIYQNRPYAVVTILTDTKGKLRKPSLQRIVMVRPESLGSVLDETIEALTQQMTAALEPVTEAVETASE